MQLMLLHHTLLLYFHQIRLPRRPAILHNMPTLQPTSSPIRLHIFAHTHTHTHTHCASSTSASTCRRLATYVVSDRSAIFVAFFAHASLHTLRHRYGNRSSVHALALSLSPADSRASSSSLAHTHSHTRSLTLGHDIAIVLSLRSCFYLRFYSV